MEGVRTILSTAQRSVVIGHDLPVVIIGERINPTGRKKMAAAISNGDMLMLKEEARSQVAAGAHVIDINVGVSGIDEPQAMIAAVKAVCEVVDVPICIDSSSHEAKEAGLRTFQGKALVNSVTGEEESLSQGLPLIKQFGAAVIGLCMDETGIPNTAAKRLEVARKIVQRAESLGIPREDVIIDPLCLTVGADYLAGKVALDTIALVVKELGLNVSGGVSNVSFGLPDRKPLNATFLAMTIARGLNCPITDPTQWEIRQTLLATDLMLGKDQYALRYITAYRQRQAALEQKGLAKE
ncbi:MAG: dihydropteroate synthase [Chloroflexi bacterium]|nr:dihydropteroate synthase [Chloroflexota bacterium]